jgi:uncharacterized protein YdhG (YjbR/CyaY superfamily)
MKTDRTAPRTIDEYIERCPRDVQETLEKIRETIRKAAPGAEEAIKYQMPAFMLKGNLVFFAACKRHIGFYGASGDRALKAELAAYAGPKGTLKFPNHEPIPFGLIRKAVRFRVKQNRERAERREKKKQ